MFSSCFISGFWFEKFSFGETNTSWRMTYFAAIFLIQGTGITLARIAASCIALEERQREVSNNVYLSCSIVESHGARLWATANDGRDATFHFHIAH
jgi:hypothetical protein